MTDLTNEQPRNSRRYVPVNGNTSSPRRRWTRLAAAVMAAASLLLVAGVSVTSAKTRATVTLKVLAQSNGQGNPQLQQVFDIFQKKNPDIKIEATYLRSATATRTRSARSSRAATGRTSST